MKDQFQAVLSKLKYDIDVIIVPLQIIPFNSYLSKMNTVSIKESTSAMESMSFKATAVHAHVDLVRFLKIINFAVQLIISAETY